MVLALVLSITNASADETVGRPTTADVLNSVYDARGGHNIADLRVGEGEGTYDAEFLGFYRRTGGFARWGAVTSEAHWDDNGLLVQYFANGILELHLSADDPSSRSVTRRLAWDFLGGGAGSSSDLGAEIEVTNPHPGDVLGPWDHKVSDFAVDGAPIGFRSMFLQFGGLESFGFPKSDARQDSGEPGTLFLAGSVPGIIRQYFQAAVLEYRESEEPAVQLVPLGDMLRDRDFPGGAWMHVAAFARSEPLVGGQQVDLDLLKREPLTDRSLEGLFEYALPSIARVAVQNGCATGFFIDRDGHLVTNYHVVQGAQRVAIRLTDGRRLTGWVAGADITHDLAIVRVPGLVSTPLEWGDSTALAQGALLASVGFPATLVGNELTCPSDPVITDGVLTARVDFFGLPYLQTNSAINPGSSGGPVLAAGGTVRGIAVSQLVAAQNTSFLIPEQRARPQIQSLLAALAEGERFETAEDTVQRFAVHSAPVRSVAWDPRSVFLASGSDDTNVALAHVSAVNPFAILRDHSGPIQSLDWSPDGNRIVSASADQAAFIWDLNGQLERTLKGHDGVVRSAAWSPAANIIATGSVDETIKIWDATTGDEVLTLEPLAGEVLAVAWSPEGNRLASSTDAGLISIWDPVSGDLLISMVDEPWPVNSIDWLPGGNLLVAGDAVGNIKIWNAATGRLHRTIPGHSNQVTGVSRSPDGRVASSSLDGTVRIWDTSTGVLSRQLTRYGGAILSVDWSADGSFIAAGLDSGRVRIWAAP